jgi:serine/threonine-protein kinase
MFRGVPSGRNDRSRGADRSQAEVCGVTSQRFLALLYTDIVGSTERAAELRDEAWQELRRRHDALVRNELRRFEGREVNTAGDSFLMTFDEPEQAIRCAAAIREGVRELGLEVRSGVHVGKVEGEGRNVGGLAFHVGARVAAEAAPGEILVTEAVRQALAGSPLDFAERGTRELKGLSGEWRLFAVRDESLHRPWTKRRTRVAWPRLREGRRINPAFATLVLGFLIGLGVLFGWLSTHEAGESPGGRRVLAVLPFENVGAAEDEYFADGMTDEIRGKLASLGGLEVIATQSSAQYKKTSKSLAQIADELGADYLVVGKVRWEKGEAGSRVRVSPELVEVGSGRAPTTRWQAPFDASLTDVFQVQADIATRVAGELDVALGSEQRRELATGPTGDLGAYDAYLKGEEVTGAMSSGDPTALSRGIEFYEQALALDPGFVPAWARLARAHARYHFNGIPTSAGAERAREAAERAVELAPGRAESQLALGDYHALVRNDAAKALAAYAVGLRNAPYNAELLAGTAFVEQTLGRWEQALEHFTRAQALDPRSLDVARRLPRTLLWLRRYPEAAAAYDRALALAPTDVGLIQGRAMVPLAQGDLAGARAVLRGAPRGVEPAALVAWMGNYWDLGWVLDHAHQRLLLGLGPDAFGGDRGTWAIVLAQVHDWRGDRESARSWADTARVGLEEQLRDAPDDPQRHAFLGLAHAYLGNREDAIRNGERATALAPIAKDAFTGPYLQHVLARTYVLVGEHEKALDSLEPLVVRPYYLSPGWLRIDPSFAPLRGNPRFERLAAGSGRPSS